MSEGELKETAAPYRAVEFKSEFAPLIDELYREEVMEARQMSPEDKFLAGESLFKSACEITLAGIRNENPGFTEEDCHGELERRLKLREWMDRNK